MNTLSDYKCFFIYGAKLEIKDKNKFHKCVMQLNSHNNFFLEFITYKDKLKIIKQVFIPHMKNIRIKSLEKCFKVRMEKDTDSFYIYNENEEKLKTYKIYFQKLICHIKKYKYAVFSWDNLMYYALYELKIYKNKDKIFAKKDVNKILERMKLGKVKGKKRNSRLVEESHEYLTTQSEEVDIKKIFLFKKTNSHRSNHKEENEKLKEYIKEEIESIFDVDNTNIDMDIVEKIFKFLVHRNDLVILYDTILEGNMKSLSSDKLKSKIVKSMSFDYYKYYDEQKNLMFEDFLNFLKEVQNEDIDAEAIEYISRFFNHIRTKDIFAPNDEDIISISFKEFCTYIFSSFNSVLNREKKVVYQNMNKPLSQYFIHSSHNTYLVGHQLYGKSGLEGYQRAIEMGCRCIEIDCWNGKEGEPIVTHGHTLTKNYSFEEIVKFLAEIAFLTNPYPLILSLEMHCNKSQRIKIATYLKQYFKEKLFIMDYDKIHQIYSPKDLMYKVLVKTDSSYPSIFNIPKKENDKVDQYSDDKLSLYTSIFKERFDEKEFLSNNNTYNNLKTPFGIISASNTKLKKYSKNDFYKKKFIEFTKNYLIRIYPDGMNIDSKNLKPIEFWNVGCQMVALNIQTPDTNQLLNKVKFQLNGGYKCGYILKPNYLRTNETIPENSLEFHIDVISSQILNSELVNENEHNLEISFLGHPEDELFNNHKFILEFKTNFLHPIIEKLNQTIVFKVIYPQLGFFIFKIKKKNSLVNISAIPCYAIRSGFRVLPLYDTHLYHNHFSYILMKFYKKKLII
jgi:hypothetical protein